MRIAPWHCARFVQSASVRVLRSDPDFNIEVATSAALPIRPERSGPPIAHPHHGTCELPALQMRRDVDGAGQDEDDQQERPKRAAILSPDLLRHSKISSRWLPPPCRSPHRARTAPIAWLRVGVESRRPGAMGGVARFCAQPKVFSTRQQGTARFRNCIGTCARSIARRSKWPGVVRKTVARKAKVVEQFQADLPCPDPSIKIFRFPSPPKSVA